MTIQPTGFYFGVFHNDFNKYQADVVKPSGKIEIFELDPTHTDLVWRMGDPSGWEFNDFKDVTHLSSYVEEVGSLPVNQSPSFEVGKYYWIYNNFAGWEPVYCSDYRREYLFQKLGTSLIYYTTGFKHVGYEIDPVKLLKE